MKKTVIYIMIITMISKLFGFVRDLVLSYFYGASNISDAYIVATTIPMVIFSFIGDGIATSYIPVFSEIKSKIGENKSNIFTKNLINILVICDTLVVLLCLLYTSQVVKIFAAGFQGDTFNIAVDFTRITIFGIYFTSIICIFRGYLQLNDNFIIPALISIPLNLVVVVSIYISAKYNYNILAIGSVIAILAQLILIIPFVKRIGYKHNFKVDFKDKYIKKIIQIALPTIIGVSVNQLNVIVDKNIASSISIGGVSALNYAYRLNGLVQGIFITSIISVLFPKLSKLISEGKITDFKHNIVSTINIMNVFLIPSIVGIMILSNPIVDLLFGRGAFDKLAIDMTADCVKFYIIGIIGFAVRDILTRGFYCMNDSKTPVYNGVISLLINIVLNIVLSKVIGISGLALATSIASIVGSILLTASFNRKIGSIQIDSILKTAIKISLASILMGVIVKATYFGLLHIIQKELLLFISIIIGILSYLLLISLLDIKEVNDIVRLIKRRRLNLN